MTTHESIFMNANVTLYKKPELYTVTSTALAIGKTRNTISRYISIARDNVDSYRSAEKIQRMKFPRGYQVLGAYQVWVIAKVSLLFDIYKDERFVINALISNAESYGLQAYKAEQGTPPSNVETDFLTVIAS